MYVFVGRFSWFDWATDQSMIFVFPSGFEAGEPVTVLWEWSITPSSSPTLGKVAYNGAIDSITPAQNQIVILSDQYYKFKATINMDTTSQAVTSLSVTMSCDDPSERGSTTFNASLTLTHPPFTPRCFIYRGTLTNGTSVAGQSVYLVVPSFVNQQSVWVYWEQNDSKATENECLSLTCTAGINDTLQITFTTYENFTFTGTITGTRRTILMTRTDGTGHTLDNPDMSVVNTLFARKQALIARYNVGVDGGIDAVRKMLIENLGYTPDNITMLYYDVEPKDKEPCQRLHGQLAPTATNFKYFFNALLDGTKPGDVRFLYVDAHGVPTGDGDNGERGPDEALKLAQYDDGITSELLMDDWISDTIAEQLDPGANLTIVASSCMGSGLLDVHKKIGGVLLSAVYETQINIKAVTGGTENIKDPWTFAVLKEIRKALNNGRRMPTYTKLFTSSRMAIRRLLAAKDQLTPSYLGPSPDPGKPVAWVENGPMTGHQDPQLVYNGWYIGVDTARFAEPFPPSILAPPPTGPTMYPRDEF